MAKGAMKPSKSVLAEFATALARDKDGVLAVLEAFNGMAQSKSLALGTRHLVPVHGICRHDAGFSDPWWDALLPYTQAFGTGDRATPENPDGTRNEVLWSDLVNESFSTKALSGKGVARKGVSETPDMTINRIELASEIKGAIRERIHGRQPLVVLPMAEGVVGKTLPPGLMTTKGLSIPGFNCIDDFTVYMLNTDVRASIIARFLDVARPLLETGAQLDVISHSFGTVVAYEALRELDPASLSGRVRNFFTVGAALSIGPVKWSLRPQNQDGKKPRLVDRWINVNAQGDPVGGHLRGNPFEVDAEYLDMPNHGCGWVDFACAHGSYFKRDNVEVNRDIFAAYINAA